MDTEQDASGRVIAAPSSGSYSGDGFGDLLRPHSAQRLHDPFGARNDGHRSTVASRNLSDREAGRYENVRARWTAEVDVDREDVQAGVELLPERPSMSYAATSSSAS